MITKTIEIPVLRRRSIPLECYDVSDADAGRFAEAFCIVWDTLNLWARRRLLLTWRQRRLLVKNYPKVVLASEHRWQSQIVKGDKTALGQFVPATGFLFCSTRLLRCPAAMIEAVICHELMHEFQAAMGKFWGLTESGRIETDCNAWVKTFGFQADLLSNGNER